MRADQLLVDRGLAESRSRAQALILAGKVFSGERRIAKAGDALAPDTLLEVRGQDHPWVSRGGLKLDHALHHFGLSPAGRISLDIGASTGGFTDVLLQRGAARVYAIDVGHGILDYRLRIDPRVVVLERTNARYLTQLAEPVSLVTVDASFIGLRLLLPAARGWLEPGGEIVALIKPQFEAGRKQVGKGGIVKDPLVHRQVLVELLDWAQANGFGPAGLMPSPIKGTEGNVEFLVWLRPGQDAPFDAAAAIEAALKT
jgi:23S rRNA (cytidine1920-2'-O)/16S rRNA (cytidine1409-2'-O)-methyltransferase